MKTYTDGAKVVEAPHRAGAFDALQEIYGHPGIGDIFTADSENLEKYPVVMWCEVGKIGFGYNPNELQYSVEVKQ
jgi:hypothetical protein